MNRDLLYASSLLLILFITAIVVYHFLEGWDWIDAAYFAASTITTVGYGDLVPTTQASKLFTIFYMLVGVSTGFYFIFSLGKFRENALRSRFDNLFESMGSVHNPLKSRKGKSKPREGNYDPPKVR